MGSLINIGRIAIADYIHEGRLSLVAILGLTAVLAPLLVLFGLKHGIVSSLLHELQVDPLSRNIQPIGQGAYDDAFFDAVRGQEGVAFLLPTTRFLSATLRVANPAAAQAQPIDAELRPTAAGDPLWDGVAPRDLGEVVEVVASAPLAQRLRLAAGDTAAGRLGRVVAGARQSEAVALKVIGVLPAHLEQRDVILVPLSFLEDTEDYREGFAVAGRGWDGNADRPKGPRSYASFRLYAATIYDVAPLRDYLDAQGVRVETAADRIAMVTGLNRALVVLFTIISTLAAGGYGVSMMLNLVATVARKKRELSVLKMLGFTGGEVAFFPVVQALATAVLGSAAGLAVYAAVAPLVNTLFSGSLRPGLVVCAIEPWHAAAAMAATLVLAIVTSISAGLRAGAIPPAEGLRSE